MRKKILEQLDLIERTYDVSIVFAAESGSRAWGFPSADSDYDVRFVYVHRPEWYLSIAPGRDVIEFPTGPVLDISGWDIRKALQLLRKSNVSVMEWLASPEQYRCDNELVAILQAVTQYGFCQGSSARHYLSMARSAIRKTDREHVRVKHYLHAIRPLLCCRWILEMSVQPPVGFRELADKYLDEATVGNVINELVGKKVSPADKDAIPKHELLDQFISGEFEFLTEMCPEERELPPVSPYDDAFRSILAKAWSG